MTVGETPTLSEAWRWTNPRGGWYNIHMHCVTIRDFSIMSKTSCWAEAAADSAMPISPISVVLRWFLKKTLHLTQSYGRISKALNSDKLFSPFPNWTHGFVPFCFVVQWCNRNLRVDWTDVICHIWAESCNAVAHDIVCTVVAPSRNSPNRLVGWQFTCVLSSATR